MLASIFAYTFTEVLLSEIDFILRERVEGDPSRKRQRVRYQIKLGFVCVFQKLQEPLG